MAAPSPRGPVPRARAEAPPRSPLPASGPAAIGSCRHSPETVTPQLPLVKAVTEPACARAHGPKGQGRLGSIWKTADPDLGG